MIGNSRLHWAWFVEKTLSCAWDTSYLPASIVKKLANCRTLDDLPIEILPPYPQRGPRYPPHLLTSSPLPLYLASVVPNQTELWQTYPNVHIISLNQIPLQGTYPTLGIDRALALWGAGETKGWPTLVIDAGTALTLSGADANLQLVGGAILPGLGLQLQSLAQRTAELPLVDPRDVASLPPRWALNTSEAIQSGVLYTILAGIRDFIEAWWEQFPESYVTLTGGDSTLLLTYLQYQFPDIAARVIADRHLIFWGIRSCYALS